MVQKRLFLGFVAAIGIGFATFGIWRREQAKELYESKHGRYEAEEEKGGGEKARTMAKEAIEFEFTRSVDPALGYVPRERLKAAMEYAKELTASHKTQTAGIVWRERGPSNVSGRSRAAMVDPNDPSGNSIFVAGVAGGVWKTSNINTNPPDWSPIDDFFNNLAVVSMAYDPSNTQNMYFGTGEGYLNLDAVRGQGIWKSTNGGANFAQLAATNNANFNFVYKLEVTSGGVILAATSTGLRRSADGGTTWAKVLGTGLGITGAGSNTCYDVDIAANGDVYATLDGSIHKSTNNGATFGAALTLPIAAGRIELACAPSDANYVYALVENGNVLAGVLRSTNAGGSFATRAEPADADPGIGATDFTRGQAWYDLCITVDPLNRDRVWAGGVDIFRSNDGCATWTQQTHWYGGFGFQYAHADQHFIIHRPGSSDQVYFGNDGGIFRTTNGSAGTPTITFKGDNFNVTQFYACAMHPTAFTDYFLAGAQDNGTQQFASAGINSTVEATGGDGAFCHIDQDQPQFQFTQYVFNDYFRSNNGGGSWTNVSSSGGRFINPTDYDNVNNRMYCARGANQYLRWDNPQTGATFTQVAVAGFGGQVSAVRVSENTSNRVFFGIDNGDVLRVDNAHTGTPTVNNISTGLPGAYVSCVEVEIGNDNHLLVTYSNYGTNSVWESVNGGATWTSVEGNLPDMPVRWALFNPLNTDEAIIATEVGVWTTDNLNGGATVWYPANTGLANTRVDMFQIRSSDNLVIAASHGRGLFSSDIFTSPNAQFGVDRPIQYNGKPFQFIDASYKATSWLWNFGDATTSTQQNPTKIYNTPGLYTVTLTINAGVDSETKTNFVWVLPNRGTPYTPGDGGNFDVNLTDFGPWNVTGTPWQRGSSAVAGKNGTFTAPNAWVTALVGNYTDNTEAHLYSPNYNFTAPGTYTLRFRGKWNAENQFDGYNLEYSLDKGDNWTTLGTSGAGWYNFANGAGGTSFPTGVPFFTGNVSASFVQYSRDVSFLAGNGNVAFRFVFKSDVSVTGPGVAVDDFEIAGPANSVGLPISGSPLRGEWQGLAAHLEWETYIESQNRGFEMERSYNGLDFQRIGFVPTRANLTGNTSYSFTDDTPGADRVWYRFRQVDVDGVSNYSNVVELSRSVQDALGATVYPNPAPQAFQVWVTGLADPQVNIEWINMEGRLLERKSYHFPSLSGNLSMDFTGNPLPQGNYLLRITNGGQTLVRRVNLTR